MVIFGIELYRKREAIFFMKETHKRLQVPNPVTNPFYGSVKKLSLQGKDKDHYILVMDPVYPKLYKMGYFLLAGAFIFTGFRWSLAYLPGLILSFTRFFWSRFFMYLGLVLGLKKAGYKGDVKLLLDSTTIRGLLNEIL